MGWGTVQPIDRLITWILFFDRIIFPKGSSDDVVPILRKTLGTERAQCSGAPIAYRCGLSWKSLRIIENRKVTSTWVVVTDIIKQE